jgi:DNA-binding HxlR family transcriptional regulator
MSPKPQGKCGYSRGNIFAQECPSRKILDILANKWSLLVIHALEEGNVRNGQLMRKVEGISQKMLTQTLRELEELNLVQRHEFEIVPPHVEYRLTKLGKGLLQHVLNLGDWIEMQMKECLAKKSKAG